MGNTNRNAAINIEMPMLQESSAQLPNDVRVYNFYQLVELLQKLYSSNPESEDWERTCQLVFSANPSLGFAPSDVTELYERKDDRLILQTNFFGLTGAQSPLPGFFLQQLVEEEPGGFKRPFLDFFNNRLISLVYRVWRKYRYYVRFQVGAQDQFSSQLFSLVGLGDADLRGETPINWCKMLAYAGTLAGRSRSPQVVAGIIAHCFDLKEVSIRQWIRRKVNIATDQQMSLGKQNGELGINTMLGESVMDCNGKFIICIKNLTRERFADFLPSGKEYQPLCKLVEFILREQMAYDLELTMDESEVPVMSLSRDSGVALGWSSFLGSDASDKNVLIQVRQ
ncbi:type VI secretion system baseplate subunit TssG [Vibrio metschnikovii]|uniref:type VI secretion system baseplate subunit TssG n=1 Tax=Vibrio metschnikovii TaxID=28172 RepID=UPI001648500A|nr:type VI secretion system baseplate subunit TssG [Vibrio metschnikovii]MBC3618532.1 type VI secretion system baseplate subunit TssG [Vibrio metschnikovii]MBC5814549.1 type VI secretion system baseplate subunit TssG [Vibrio metschnikovii]